MNSLNLSEAGLVGIFDDSTLHFAEATIVMCTSIGRNVKSSLSKACKEYRFLKEKKDLARGLTKEVILFLLDPISSTEIGIQEFVNKCSIWLKFSSEIEQETYFFIEELDPSKVLIVREKLINVVYYALINTKLPMQLDPWYSQYLAMMESYGNEYLQRLSREPWSDIPGRIEAFQNN